MMLATIKMSVSPDNRRELLDAVRLVLGPAEAEPGCLGCGFYEELDRENSFILVEAWRERTDLEDHLAGRSFEILLSAMELLASAPAFEFHVVPCTEGLEVIKAARVKIRARGLAGLGGAAAQLRRAARKCAAGSRGPFLACGPVLDGRIGYGKQNGKSKVQEVEDQCENSKDSK